MRVWSKHPEGEYCGNRTSKNDCGQAVRSHRGSPFASQRNLYQTNDTLRQRIRNLRPLAYPLRCAGLFGVLYLRGSNLGLPRFGEQIMRSSNSFIFKKKDWCPGRESNPHEEKSSEDFKSSASAIPPPGHWQKTGSTLREFPASFTIVEEIAKNWQESSVTIGVKVSGSRDFHSVVRFPHPLGIAAHLKPDRHHRAFPAQPGAICERSETRTK